MCYTALFAERQDDLRSRPYNTVLRNPPNIWGEGEEGEEGEPDGWVVEPANLETVLHAPDAIKRFGFDMFDVVEQREFSSYYARRYARFAGQPQAVLLDETQTFRVACCLEQHGFTFRFAYIDEEEIDDESNYKRFAKWLRTSPVREFDLALRASEGGVA